MKPPGTAFGQHVRCIRQQQHRTIEAAAAAIGISYRTLSKIERGVTHRPKDEILHGLERVLGIPYVYALEVLGAVPPCNPSAHAPSLDRLVALPTLDARLHAWRELPPHLKRSLIQLVHDVLAHGIPSIDGATAESAAGSADSDPGDHAAPQVGVGRGARTMLPARSEPDVAKPPTR